jgi:hypothetical protein
MWKEPGSRPVSDKWPQPSTSLMVLTTHFSPSAQAALKATCVAVFPLWGQHHWLIQALSPAKPWPLGSLPEACLQLLGLQFPREKLGRGRIGSKGALRI